MSIEQLESLFEKGVAIKNKASSQLLPKVMNNTVLVGSSLVVLLATLSDPESHNILLYRTLLCTLLLSIVLGVLCTSIVTIDLYKLGNKVSDEVIKSIREGVLPKYYLRTGKTFYFLIVSTFGGCLLAFLASVILLVFYAW
ncbi:MAG: hypothetical protein GX163_11220 [Bacteroidetes bacterium]|jgi:hypothetical protein|nr:hypothetical protein [Bacteroidota bacterium]